MTTKWMGEENQLPAIPPNKTTVRHFHKQSHNRITSHMIADLSLDDDAKYLPLFENCRYHTSSRCDCNTCAIQIIRSVNGDKVSKWA